MENLIRLFEKGKEKPFAVIHISSFQIEKFDDGETIDANIEG